MRRKKLTVDEACAKQRQSMHALSQDVADTVAGIAYRAKFGPTVRDALEIAQGDATAHAIAADIARGFFGNPPKK